LKLRILSVGKPREREVAALHDRYARRIENLGIDYEAVWVPDVKQGGRYSDEHVMEREARMLSEHLPLRRGNVVALDRGGLLLDSVALSRRLESWASPLATIVIGGPLGLHERLLKEADCRWSLSPLTFPHELTRVLVAEQLYRAATILRGLPYHK
jgi:23S rRNA (pseudouridine1915-N3)-methyltransferase